jgi:hypothetical protein
MFALIDLAKGPVATPAVGDRFICSGLPAAAPAVMFEFEIPETSVARNETFSDVMEMRVIGKNLRASISAGGGSEIVQLAADFVVADLSYSDTFWANHSELERDGRIKHQSGQCPSRLPQVIRRWMPDLGWQDFKVTPTIRSALPQDQR